jgi:hypothetical protein
MRRPLSVLKYDIHGCPILPLLSTSYKLHKKSNLLILPVNLLEIVVDSSQKSKPNLSLEVELT